MSLFGQSSASSTGGGSGLFSGLNASSGAEQPLKRRTSIFAPSGETASTQLGGLFENLNTTSASSSSVFGGATTTSAGPSFSLGSTTTTSAPSGGLFANLNKNTTASTTPGGLFSSTSSANAQPATTGTSSFGGSTLLGSTMAPPTGSSSTFGGAPPPQATQGVQSQTLRTQSQSRDPAYFSSLLERQKKKPRFTGGTPNSPLSQLSNFNMDLGDLARRAQGIGGRDAGAASTNGLDSRAHYLLAGSGVSPGKAYKDFQALERDDSGTEFTPTHDFDPDNGKYIRNLQQKGREAMIRESMDRVNAEFDAFLQESLNLDFAYQKRRVMEHFGLVPKNGNTDTEQSRESSAQGRGSFGKSSKAGRVPVESVQGATRSVFGKSALEKSIIGTPGLNASTASFFGEDVPDTSAFGVGRGQNERNLREKERLFIQKVEQLNQARLHENIFPILQEFGQVESSAGGVGDSPRQLVDAYDALKEITKENAQATNNSDPSAIRERHYAAMYLDDKANSLRSVKMRRQILDGSRSYLEKAFYKEVESLIQKNPREAQLGGQPTILNKMRAYVRVRSARRDLAPDGSELQQIGENGDYCWVLIFYLLRCGFVKEAADYVASDPAFQSTDKRFISYLTTYSNSNERRLTRKLQEMINGEYQQRQRIAPEHSVDPYRMACYKIVGRCDINRRNLDTVGQGVEDWIWLQFSLARESERMEELSGDSFGLEQICDTVHEIGQKHFQKNQADVSGGYGTFFFMQILAGMFEQAVAYLNPHNPASAIHFAISLAYYGLLRVSDYTVAGNELLTFSTTQQPLINFVPLLAYYTAAFRTALPSAAVDYLALICLNSDLTPVSLGESQTSACHECLRQLCLETREFALLLGDIRSDGARIPGAIESKAKLIKLDSHESFLKAVTLQAAVIADERGQVSDAVLLYHLCEEYDNVVGVLNRALADAATLDLGESPLQLQPLKPRYQKEENSNSQQNGPASSISLTQSTSSSVELAENMVAVYTSNAAYYQKISVDNRRTISSVLLLLQARFHLESNPPRYMECLEELNSVGVLPLKARGNIQAIRLAAASFGGLTQILARCAGVSIVWAITAIGREREDLARQGGWSAGSGDERESMREQLNAMAKDLMVFAGLVKYKLPTRVYDMLTRVGGDVGVY